MPDKNRYQALLRGKVSSVIEEAKSLSSFSHAGTKGSVLEKLIKNLFLPLLPSDIGVGTGQIIDQHGKNISKQIDIVLYDKSILPPILFDGGVGIFPIESVLYAIEVKTTINNQELITAHDSAGELTNFIYIPGLENEDGTVKHHKIEKLRSVVFALNSNLSESTLSEAKRYEKIYKSKGEKPFIRAICVAGRSYCYDNGEN
jgi:hypothetical protein